MLLKWIKWSGTSAKKKVLCVCCTHTSTHCLQHFNILFAALSKCGTKIIQGVAGDKGTQCALTDYAAQRGLRGVENGGWREAVAHPLFMKF